MIDRGIKKWQPFNSCFSGKNIISDINTHKNKIKFPILSEDQLNVIGIKIKDAYNLKINVNLVYFYDGEIKKILGIIKSIDMQEKKIFINNHYIYFTQILEINF